MNELLVFLTIWFVLGLLSAVAARKIDIPTTVIISTGPLFLGMYVLAFVRVIGKEMARPKAKVIKLRDAK